eukprot:5902265-Pleurochrysis_carterae.AAC.3
MRNLKAQIACATSTSLAFDPRRLSAESCGARRPNACARTRTHNTTTLVHARKRSRSHACDHAHNHACVRTHAQARAHPHTRSHTYARTRPSTHARARTRTHARTRTLTRT